MLATSPAGPFCGAFFFCSGFALRPPLSAIAVSPRYLPDARLVTLRCPNFVRSCPLRGVSRRGKGGFPHCRRADFRQIGVGFFVVAFYASYRKSTQETARAGKRISRIRGGPQECLKTLTETAFRPWFCVVVGAEFEPAKA